MAINSISANITKYNLNNEPWDIICDFDGTISLIDVTDSLLEKFATPEWEDI